MISESCDNALEMMDKAMEQIKHRFPLGIACKTKHYASENETRLIYQYPNDLKELPADWAIKKIQAFTKRNMINTYIPLGFPKNIIKKIVLGPKYQKNFFETEVALEVLGYAKVDIEQSTSGYR